MARLPVFHTFPGDLRHEIEDHVLGSGCWCQPDTTVDPEWDEDGAAIVVHHQPLHVRTRWLGRKIPRVAVDAGQSGRV